MQRAKAHVGAQRTPMPGVTARDLPIPPRPAAGNSNSASHPRPHRARRALPTPPQASHSLLLPLTSLCYSHTLHYTVGYQETDQRCSLRKQKQSQTGEI
jgi:hypothetical protein